MLDRYQYAGLAVASDLPLPELPPATGDGGNACLRVHIRTGPVIPVDAVAQWRHDWLDPQDKVSLSGLRIGSQYGLEFPGVAQAWFTLDGDIALWRDPDASVESLRHILLDQVIPRLIAQRGTLVLHGSVATTSQGGTVVILGNSGMGKSTLASGIALAGGSVLTDDCLTISLDDAPDRARVVPSYPGLRLWPDSLTALFEDRRAEATPMTHYSDKHRLPPASAATASHGPTPCLDAVLVLQEDDGTDAIAIRPMSPQQACMAVIGNAFQMDMGDLRHTHKLLGLAAELARRVPVRALHYPRDYAALPRVVDRLCAELVELAAA